MIRWPRPWRSQEDRDEARWWTGRMEAQARGMRQAASRDLPASGWQPGPVPPPPAGPQAGTGTQRTT